MKINVGKLVAWALVAVFVIAFVGFIGGKVLAPLAVEGGELVLGNVQLSDLVFGGIATLTVAGAAGVALSRNILYSALSLLAALMGAAGLYVMLSADFLAVTQVLVYIGGVLVLVLFAVMLTNQITEVNVSNRSIGLAGGVLLFLATAAILVFVAVKSPWAVMPQPAMVETTAAIGDAFLTKWLLPFELASLVLLATLIGAVVIARKELKAD
jgi:NAD(P)H-quinone oxidoreductase subunit 6